MSARDNRPGNGRGDDHPGPRGSHGGPEDEYSLEELAAMPLDQVDRLGASYDGVRIAHVDPGPRPGSRLEKRAVRQVGLTFFLAGLFALAFIVVYVGSGWFLPEWSWTQHPSTWSALFTPLQGAFLGLSLILVGLGFVLFSRKLLPHETAIQDKHIGSTFDRQTTSATLLRTYHNSGLDRRKLLTRSLLFMGGGLGLALIMPLGGMIKNPNKGNPLGTTPWGPGVRLVRDDGTPIRPGDQEPGSMQTVFPAVPGGNRASDAATMLFRLRPQQLANERPRPGQENYGYGDYVAYSKVCTHAGCPVSLYEQETSRILCPCHQSQFDITQGAKPVFGPAVRPLPQLPITLDAEGFFVARDDYPEAIGPTYWNRERI